MAKKSLIKQADQQASKSAKEAARWKSEIQAATKREKPWRDDGEKIVKLYRGEDKKKNRYNILWANTEILRPAIYNSRPNPDVRRRFRDNDPTGKAVSEVLERSLFVMVDSYELDCACKNDVLDSLLPGRGVSRLKYVPSITQTPRETPAEEATEEVDESPDTLSDEELEYEQAVVEHVDWRDYRQGYGRTWDEVPWTAYRHKLTRTDCKMKFDENDFRGIKFAQPTNDDPNKPGQEVQETSKIAEFWEVWDKEGQRVFFVQEDLDHLLFPKDNKDGAPPIDFNGFFPSPEPLRMVEDTSTQIPIPPYQLYEEQAKQLDKLTGRIDHIVAKMKLRGVYDAKLTELSSLMDSAETELVPVQNAQAWLQSGLDKAISWMPVDQAVAILNSLYEARARQKAIIDELTGISDIVRGDTDPNETMGAQQLKSNYASIRLQRMQKEVQRYVRDLIRLASDVMCEKFGAETFAQMTGLNFPTAEQKQQMQMQFQQQQLMQQQQAMQQQAAPPMPGQPPAPPAQPPAPMQPPPALQVPSWDEIIQMMRSNAMRQFRIDVETDSTIAGTLDSDMKGLAEVMGAITQTIGGLSPLVQAGALPADAAKELVLTVVRRSRMGTAVEDQFDKLQAPQPPPPPVDHSVEVAKIKADSDQKVATIREQSEQQQIKMQAQSDQMHQTLEAQRNQFSEQLKHQREQSQHQQKLQAEHFDSQLQAQKELALEERKAANSLMETKLDAAVRIIVAQIAAKSKEDAAAASAQREVTQDLS